MTEERCTGPPSAVGPAPWRVRPPTPHRLAKTAAWRMQQQKIEASNARRQEIWLRLETAWFDLADAQLAYQRGEDALEALAEAVVCSLSLAINPLT